MSRIEEEYIMAVVRNRSGIDSGEIDYSIPAEKFQRQRINDLLEIKATLSQLRIKCQDRIEELEAADETK